MKNILFAIFIVFLSGCSINIKSIINNNTCKYPCWYQITPGTTNEYEAIKILKNLEFIRDIKIINTSWQKCTKYIEFSINNNHDTSICVDNEVIQSIHFSKIGDYKIYDFINIYGEPDRVSCQRAYSPDVITFGDSPHRYLKLYYLEIPEIVSLDYPGSEFSVNIQETTNIYQLSIYSQESFDSKIDIDNSFIKNLPIWKGFIEYNCSN